MNAAVLVAAVALAVTVVLGFAALRVVPAGHCGVVMGGAGGAVATLGSGTGGAWGRAGRDGDHATEVN